MSAIGREKKKREFYEVLGIPPGSNGEDVKRAYKRLALQFHPDRNKGNEQEAAVMFKRVTEAYESLQASKDAFNKLKSGFKSQDIQSSLEHFFFTSSDSVLQKFGLRQSSSVSDFSGSPLHHNGTETSTLSPRSSPSISTTNTTLQPTPHRGQNLQSTIPLTFGESITGCRKIIRYNRALACKVCKGAGNNQEVSPLSCESCRATGLLFINTGGVRSTICPSCHASSVFNPKPCSSCQGEGKVTTTNTLTIEVPPGVPSGWTKVFEGAGDEGANGGVPGNFIVKFTIEAHPFFHRQGDDALCSVIVPFPSAMLGVKLNVPTIYGGNLEVELKPGLSMSDVIVLRGHGFPVLSTFQDEPKKGDMIVHISIDLPQNLTQEEKTLLQRLSEMPSFQNPSNPLKRLASTHNL